MCPATMIMGRAPLGDDEGVVALDPPVGGEDEEYEPDCEHLAVLGDGFPVELDDVAESLGVVAPAEAEPLGADPVLVRARRASLYLLVSPCLEDRRQQEPQTAGELIRFWRTRRGLSQLELSLDANVSTKHLSFVETGRSSPSRQLLVHLAQRLDLPIAERNRLLLAGGFAPPYLELPYDGEVMQPLRESLERLLEAHEPNPALIVDGLWNLIEANRAASLLWVAWPAGGSC